MHHMVQRMGSLLLMLTTYYVLSQYIVVFKQCYKIVSIVDVCMCECECVCKLVFAQAITVLRT